MTMFGLTVSDELATSVIVGVIIPLILKVIEHYVPWLTIRGAGSHIKRADPDES